MPEYLVPGVYVEETSFHSKSIEGVNTDTTAFVGPTRRGPKGGTPRVLTSLGDFERIYGGLNDLHYSPNYLAHAVRVYFDNGGKRLYVSRVVGTDATMAVSMPVVAGSGVTARARFVALAPGEAGNGVVSLNLIATPVSAGTLPRSPSGSLLRIGSVLATRQGNSWHDASGMVVDVTSLANGEVLTMKVSLAGQNEAALIIEDIGFDREHPRWIGHVLPGVPFAHTNPLENPYALEMDDDVSVFELFDGLFGRYTKCSFVLTGGSDGTAPDRAAYEAALTEISSMKDIATVAAPGHSAYADHVGIQQALIAHVEAAHANRMLVLDTPPGQSIQEARDSRGRIDSAYAALYYPWVVASNPLFKPGQMGIPSEVILPPSGFVCGIFARNDIGRGVHKAPADEVIRGALRLERDVSKAELEVLNPIGVNCLRHIPERGYRVWGARTASSDREWKYINVRRYANYLEESIERGTQWAAFEPIDERLWSSVRRSISDFLYNEWKIGALLGGKPEEAFFVRCDRSTMPQADLDNGRIICLFGVAMVKPAEFIILRVSQKTADDNR